MEERLYDYGMIGLGTMGRNLVYNMCNHGFTVAGFDKDLSKVETRRRRVIVSFAGLIVLKNL